MARWLLLGTMLVAGGCDQVFSLVCYLNMQSGDPIRAYFQPSTEQTASGPLCTELSNGGTAVSAASGYTTAISTGIVFDRRP